MGTKRIKTQEKAANIVRNDSPWVNPIVITAKKSQSHKPPRRGLYIDYTVLNNLIPPVTKVHSKTKIVLTLVPLPKIDKIYARHNALCIYAILI